MSNETDDPFVAQLTQKLERIRSDGERGDVDVVRSPVEAIFEQGEIEDDIVVPLKTKASINFGAPLGRL